MPQQSNPVSSIVQETNTVRVEVPTETDAFTFTFRVDGRVRPLSDFEITDNEDNSVVKENGVTKAVNIIAGPRGVDSFEYEGDVVEADVPDSAVVYLNDEEVSVDNLLSYYENKDSNGDGDNTIDRSGPAWDNPWFVLSAAGVGLSAVGIIQRSMDDNN